MNSEDSHFAAFDNEESMKIGSMIASFSFCAQAQQATPNQVLAAISIIASDIIKKPMHENMDSFLATFRQSIEVNVASLERQYQSSVRRYFSRRRKANYHT